MNVKIYYNGKCSKCWEALAHIKDSGQEPEIVEYLKDVPDFKEISDLLERMGLEPRDAMRSGEDIYKELGLDNPSLSRERLITAMVENPILIQRPIVVTNKGTAICRPAENVKKLL